MEKFKERNLDQILSDGVYEFKMLFVFNGDAQHTDNQNVINQINDDKITFWDTQKLHQRIADLMITQDSRRLVKFTFKPENSNTQLGNDVQALISFTINSIKAVSFRMNALHLCELVTEEQRVNGTIGELFSGNIRGYLGPDNYTNKKITATLKSDNRYYFPFLNNGVTIISSKFTQPSRQIGNYLIDCENPVIVNGLQTTNTIYEIYQIAPELLHGVSVLVRLYETTDLDLIDLITDATNTQSAIDFSDKLSNKPFMKSLKLFFAARGADLATKRGDTFRNFVQNGIRPSIEISEALNMWYFTFLVSEAFLDYKNYDAPKFVFEAINNETNILFDYFNKDIFKKQIFAVNWLLHQIEQEIFSQIKYRIGTNVIVRIILEYALENNFDADLIHSKIEEIRNEIIKSQSNAFEIYDISEIFKTPYQKAKRSQSDLLTYDINIDKFIFS